VHEDVLNLLAARKGHFLFESGHHGDLWLNLELLYLGPRRVRLVTAELAKRLSGLDIEIVCGPLVEGAFVGLTVASELDVQFSYSERFARPAEDGLFPAGYRIPAALQDCVRKRRVAIVTDVINAGSAVRGTFADLQECGATIVAIGALLVLGTAAFEFAFCKNVILESIAALPTALWRPSECPLCSFGDPLEDVAGFRSDLPAKAKHEF
jgi:orotate phosphoribosyltransferase